MSTQLKPNETIYDVAIREYGHMQGIYNLTHDNDLSYSDVVEVGAVLEIDETVDYSELEPANQQLAERNETVEVAPEANQNLFDMSIQQYGSIDGVFNIVNNNNISVSTQVEVGAELDVSGEILEKLVYDYFKPRSKPATGSDVIIDAEPVLEGIDYWAIEFDFIVK